MAAWSGLLFAPWLLAAAAPAPPEWLEGPEREVVVRAGEAAHVLVRALDPLGRSVKYEAQGLPAQATLLAEPGRRNTATLSWTPGDGDVGSHELSIIASTDSGSSAQKLRLLVEKQWDAYLVPGVAYTTYVPHDVNKWGFLHGVSLEFLMFSWIHQNERPGPALGRVYLDLDILGSTKTQVFTELDLVLGLAVSVERNPSRNYLLPYYGVEIGALFAKQLVSTLAHLTPLVGVQLYASSSLSINLSGGYLVPLRGSDFDELRGLRAKLGVNVAFW